MAREPPCSLEPENFGLGSARPSECAPAEGEQGMRFAEVQRVLNVFWNVL